MDKTSSRAQKLRTSVARDAKTGKFVEKPTPPRMREVVKGSWSYREVRPNDERETRKEKAG